MKKDSPNKYSVIFKEIEKIKQEDPAYKEFEINEEDLLNDKVIRSFSEICREIGAIEITSNIYLTFS